MLFYALNFIDLIILYLAYHQINYHFLSYLLKHSFYLQLVLILIPNLILDLNLFHPTIIYLIPYNLEFV